MKRIIVILVLCYMMVGTMCQPGKADDVGVELAKVLYGNEMCKTSGMTGIALLEVGTDWSIFPFTLTWGPIGIKTAIVEGYSWPKKSKQCYWWLYCDSSDPDIDVDLAQILESENYSVKDLYFSLLPVYLYLDPLYWNKPVTKKGVVLLQPYIYAGGSYWATKYHWEKYLGGLYESDDFLMDDEYSRENILEVGVGLTAISVIDVHYAYRKSSWEDKPEHLIRANFRLGGLIARGVKPRSMFRPHLNGHLQLPRPSNQRRNILQPNVLNAGEESQLTIQVANYKQGYDKTAKDIKLYISTESSASNYITASEEVKKIGKLKPGESTTITLPVKVDPETPGDYVEFILRGFDKNKHFFSDRLTVKIQMIPPNLTIVPIKANNLHGSMADGELSANDKGNLSVTIRNDGKGISHGLKVRVSSDNRTVSVQSPIEVGELRGGESRTIEVPVTTARDTESGSVRFTVEAIDDYDYKADAKTPEIPVAQGKPNIVLTAPTFSETTCYFQNRALDAGERGELRFTIENQGRGTAFDVELSVEVDNPDVSFSVPNDGKLGQLYVGEPTEVTIPISADFSAKDAPATFRIEVKDRSFSGDRKDVRLNVIGLRKPELEFASLQIDDSPGGARRGDGDGIPSNEEIVEIAAIIRNGGVGDALGVTLELTEINDGIDIQVKKVELGTIRPNQNVEGRLRFSVPRTYKAERLDYTLRVSDMRGSDVAVSSKSASVAMTQNVPILACELTPKGTVINGASTDFTATVQNIGKLAAKGVKLRLETQGASINPAFVEIGALDSAKNFPQPFSVTLPRSYNRKTVDITPTLSQDFFSSEAVVTKSFPVELHAPKFELSVSDDKNGRVKLGDTLTMSAKIKNIGDMDALESVVEASTTQAKVEIMPTSQPLGMVGQGQFAPIVNFSIHVLRTGAAGKLPITLVVSEKDFGQTTHEVTYTIISAAPDLSLTAEITDKLPGQNGNDAIEQGEKALLNVTIKNSGDMPASGVKVTASTKVKGVTIETERGSPQQYTQYIGQIGEVASENVKFTFDVPRGVEIPIGQKSIPFPIDIVVEQDDFDGIQQTLTSKIYEVGVEQVVIDEEKAKEESPGALLIDEKPSISEIEGIRDGQIFYSSPIKFSVSADDDRELKQVYVQQGDTKVYDSGTIVGKRSHHFETPPIRLQEGKNRLLIVAIDNNRQLAEVKLEIAYEQVAATSFVIDNPDSIDVNIPKTNLDNPDAIAVVIGNKDYQHFPQVDYAIRDARAICNYLIEMLGYKKQNIILVENATKGRLDELFGITGVPEGELYNRVKPKKSDVFIYYSGHGLPAAEGKKYGYLVPVDCTGQNYRLSGYSMNTFYENVKQIPAKNLTVVFDACFSGKTALGDSLITEVSGGAGELTSPFYKAADNPLSRDNSLIFASSNGEQFSNWYKEKRHGLFTYFFLKGMRGEADKNGDNEILGSELELYLCDDSEGVPHYAAIAGRPQIPVVMGDKGRVIVRLKQ